MVCGDVSCIIEFEAYRFCGAEEKDEEEDDHEEEGREEGGEEGGEEEGEEEGEEGGEEGGEERGEEEGEEGGEEGRGRGENTSFHVAPSTRVGNGVTRGGGHSTAVSIDESFPTAHAPNQNNESFRSTTSNVGGMDSVDGNATVDNSRPQTRPESQSHDSRPQTRDSRPQTNRDEVVYSFDSPRRRSRGHRNCFTRNKNATPTRPQPDNNNPRSTSV